MRSLFTFDAHKARSRRAFAYAYTMLSNKDSITAAEGGDDTDIVNEQSDVIIGHETKHNSLTRQRQEFISSHLQPYLSFFFVADNLGFQKLQRLLALQYLRFSSAGALFYPE